MTTPSPLPRVCVFCRKIEEGSVQREALRVFSFEPLHPVTPGHRLFIVDAHFALPHHEPTLAGLAYSAAARHAGEQGGAYNLIVNAGDAASQTIPHVHVHYVPRERNDGLMLPWTEQHEEAARRSVVSTPSEAEALVDAIQLAIDTESFRMKYDEDPGEPAGAYIAVALIERAIDSVPIPAAVSAPPTIGTDANPASAIHQPGCEEWCNHCAICGAAILYGARCRQHEGVYPAAAPPTITDEMVERAARALYDRTWPENREPAGWSPDGHWRGEARAALRAALGGEA